MKKRNQIIKSLTRIFIVLSVVFITFASVLMYSTNFIDMTVFAQDTNNPSDVPVIEFQEIISNTGVGIPAKDLSIVEIEGVYTAPIVQPMSGAALDPNSLYSGTAYDSFFENSVFVGDSLSVGFTNYCQSRMDSIATESTYFLARTSCSAQIAISANALSAHANVMPIYNGTVTYPENAIAQMPNIEKVFICYGMNDLVGSSPEKFINDMNILVDRILEKSNNVNIYIISVPCIYEGKGSGNLSNQSIAATNRRWMDVCNEKGWGFINLSEYLMNANGAIRPELSSDHYVHENNAAYDIWTKVLRNYAYEGMSVNE